MAEKIEWLCGNCHESQWTTKQSIQRNKSGFCKKCYSVATQKGIKRPQFSNSNSPRWNGGEYISSDGYRMIKIEGKYCESGRQLYKKEHVLVYEKHLGRELLTERGGSGESVHHINGNKLDNRLDNLILCNGSSDHRNYHCQLEEIAFELVRQGKIKFNLETKTYYVK